MSFCTARPAPRSQQGPQRNQLPGPGGQRVNFQTVLTEAELAEVRWLSLDDTDKLLEGMFPPVRAYLGRDLRFRDRSKGHADQHEHHHLARRTPSGPVEPARPPSSAGTVSCSARSAAIMGAEFPAA